MKDYHGFWLRSWITWTILIALACPPRALASVPWLGRTPGSILSAMETIELAEDNPEVTRLSTLEYEREVVVLSTAFSRDGARIVTAEEEGACQVWLAETGRELLALQASEPFVNSVGFSPDGSRIFTAGGKSTRRLVEGDVLLVRQGAVVRTWDSSLGVEVNALEADDESWMLAAAFDAHGSFLMGIDARYTLRVWWTSNGHEALVLKAPGFMSQGRSNPSTVQTAFSSNARRAASVLSDSVSEAEEVRRGAYSRSTLKLWDIEKYRFRSVEYSEHMPGQWSVAVSPDGNHVVTGDLNHTLTIWNFDSEEIIEALKPPTHGPGDESQEGQTVNRARSDRGVSFLKFSPDGKYLVSGSRGGVVRVWDFEARCLVQTIKGPKYPTRDIAFLPGKLRILVGGDRLGGNRSDRITNGNRPKTCQPLEVWESAFNQD
ncbi:hypothetical protein BH23PLA1_BH23PLA1_20430 [soil metagenome]